MAITAAELAKDNSNTAKYAKITLKVASTPIEVFKPC
jgi:hypothetical protein